MAFFSRIPDKVLRSARSILYSLRAEKLIYRTHRPGDVIVMYHNVLPLLKRDLNMRNVSVADFTQTLSYLKKNFCVIPLREMLTTESDLRRIAITFDDGLVNNLNYALPVLEALKMHATFFVSTPWINGSASLWPDQLSRVLQEVKGDILFGNRKFSRVVHNHFKCMESGERLEMALLNVNHSVVETFIAQLISDHGIDLENDRAPEEEWRVMKGEEIKILAASKFVEIGGHTVSHRNLLHLNDQQLNAEIVENKHYLEQICKKDIDMFAFPFGCYSQRIVNACYDVGYEHLVAVTEADERIVSKNEISFRLGLYNDTSVVDQLHLINKSFA